jgi:ribonuclease P protein component
VVAALSSTRVVPRAASVWLSDRRFIRESRESFAVQPLQQWSDFQLTMANGRQIRTPHFVLHHWQANEPSTGPELSKVPALRSAGCDQPRLGVVVPKRLAKKAVTRNLIRRQVRELFQARHDHLPLADYVVRLRQGFVARDFISASSVPLKQKVRMEVEQLVHQLLA